MNLVKILCVAAGAVLAVPLASGWSLAERSILKKIPAPYSNHTASFVLNPSDADVAAAVAFGTASKENGDPLEYAYIFRARESFLENDSIYVRFATPLALIAQHVRDQSKDYKKPDPEFIAFARSLKAVSLFVTQQFMQRDFSASAFQWQLILLRDGERVEPLTEVPAWKGGNPFAAKSPFATTQSVALSSIQQAALQQLRLAAANMDENGKQIMAKQLATAGWSPSQIGAALGTAQSSSETPSANAPETKAPATVPVGEREAVYAIEELRKPGRYEIVFRRPQVTAFSGVKEKEVRFAVSFERFR